MNHFSIFCILLGGLPSIFAYRCLSYPVSYLESGCAIRNLTVRDGHFNLLADDRYCDTSLNLPSNNLDWPYYINFTNSVGPEYKYSTFLLVVLDNTSKQLLWMVANITVPTYDKKLTPLTGFYNRPYTLKPYEKPAFNATRREHQIEFLVFQQRMNFPPYAHFIQQSNQPFNLLQWLNVQISNGAMFCGPVAGGMARIYDTSSYPPVHSSTYPPYPSNHDQQHGGNLYPTLSPISPPHHRKNGAFNFSSRFNTLVAIIGTVLCWCLRI